MEYREGGIYGGIGKGENLDRGIKKKFFPSLSIYIRL